jgi:NAD(P)-dependent dehydrogenase (short-subunit alcohol dehydrogenase family)
MTELRFDNRVAVITGGGRGLGRSYALLLAGRGARIVVNDPGAAMQGEGVDEGPAEQVVAEIRAAGGEAVACTASVATPEGAREILATATDAFGSADILIHSAGNVRRGTLKELSYEDFNAVLDVHLRGAYNMVREAFPLMAARGYGRIVLTSSINGLYGKALNVNYALCKSGMIGLSNTAALEGAAEGIKSNLIVPAAVTRMSDGIDTSQFPPMEPEMVAPIVAFLCHESCDVSGEIYVAMGGRIGRAFIAETPGLYDPAWSIEKVAEKIDAIRDASAPVTFPPLPDGQLEHLLYGFKMAREGGA